MTEEEKNRDLRQIDGILALGGGRMSEFARGVIGEYLDGTIDWSEMLVRIRERYAP